MSWVTSDFSTVRPGGNENPRYSIPMIRGPIGPRASIELTHGTAFRLNHGTALGALNGKDWLCRQPGCTEHKAVHSPSARSLGVPQLTTDAFLRTDAPSGLAQTSKIASNPSRPAQVFAESNDSDSAGSQSICHRSNDTVRAGRAVRL